MLQTMDIFKDASLNDGTVSRHTAAPLSQLIKYVIQIDAADMLRNTTCKNDGLKIFRQMLSWVDIVLDLDE